MRRFNSLLLLLASLVLVRCSSDEGSGGRALQRPSLQQQARTLQVNIAEEEPYQYGDTLYITVGADLSGTERITRIQVYDGATDRMLFTTEEASFALPTALTGGGQFRLKIEADFSSGQKGLRYKAVEVQAPTAAQVLRPKLVASYQHDTNAYTQGLQFYKGYLFEGTGNYGQSLIRKLRFPEVEVVLERALSSDYFGEGITLMDEKLYQLTYKASTAFIYKADDFSVLGQYGYQFETGEGWGLTNDGTYLIASDGSAWLYFLSRDDFREVKRIRAFDSTGNVERLNELEYVGERIYANVYGRNRVVSIDPATGMVVAEFDAGALVSAADRTPDMDVLNGIASLPNGNLLLTGKYWSKYYEVTLEQAPA